MPITVSFNDEKGRTATAGNKEALSIHDSGACLLAKLSGEEKGGRVSFIERNQIDGNQTFPEIRVMVGESISHRYMGVGVTATVRGS